MVAVWRRPAKRGPETPLVVLLHGLGADEHDLIDLARSLPPAFAYASVRAPLAHAEGGYTWFTDRGVARPVAASLRSSLTYVREWLDGPECAPYNRERTYLLGFSAGMIMSAALALDDPARIAGAVLLSGVVAFDAGVDTSPDRLHRLPVFYGFSSNDPVVPRELALRSARYLREKSGATLTEREYAHGHAIGDREVADIRAWFDALG
jgi:phospholipase/carboxylesterase